MSQTFTTKSPERGWPPFMEWLKDQGLDPNSTAGIVVHDDGSAVAVVYPSPRRVVDGELVTEHRRIDKVTGPPPLRYEEVQP